MCVRVSVCESVCMCARVGMCVCVCQCQRWEVTKYKYFVTVLKQNFRVLYTFRSIYFSDNFILLLHYILTELSVLSTSYISPKGSLLFFLDSPYISGTVKLNASQLVGQRCHCPNERHKRQQVQHHITFMIDRHSQQYNNSSSSEEWTMERILDWLMLANVSQLANTIRLPLCCCWLATRMISTVRKPSLVYNQNL